MFLVLVLGPLAYSPAVSKLVSHYEFKSAGDFSNSVIGSGPVGTPEGNAQIIWDDERASYVLSLDGDGDYVNCGNEDIAHIDTAITVAAWIKTDSLANEDYVVGKGYAWRLRGTSSNSLRFHCSRSQPSGSQVAGSVDVNDGTWHHVAGTYDGTEYNLYVDGKLDGSMEAPGSIDSWDGYWFCIGAHYKKDTAGDPRFFWDGLIDDVRVYDVALSEAEILLISGLGSNASEPSPADGQTDVGPDVVLRWKPGRNIDKHDVYFGSSLEDVKQATTTSDPNNVYKGRQDLSQYPVSVTLDLEKTYYWRIDEVSGPPNFTIHEGRVWSFTTELFSYPIENITATASSVYQVDMGPENTINGSGLDDNELHSTDETGMWLSSTEPLGAWVEYQFDKTYKLHEMWVWNSNRMIEPFLGLGFKDVTIEYSTNGIDYTTLGTTVEFAQAPGAVGYAHNTTIDFGSAAGKYIRLTANNNWGGVMPQYGLSEIRFLYIPASAREPYPEDEATGVDLDVVLDWTAGRGAATHDVYVSTDEQAVIDGTAPVVTVAETSYGPLALDLDVTYYWRVDEVNEAEIPTTWESNLWSFTTTDHLVVDDFESYNDLEATEAGSNRIFNVWIDGYDIDTNGSIVGYGLPPFAEQTIVHGGKQAMPLAYDNTGSAAYSEAERTFAAAQNWTKAGATTLVLYFHGTEGNTGQLYVKVNGTKVVYDGDAGDIAKPQWQQWNIDIASLGVDLQNITKLAIGIDGIGASGTLYVDDIGLYRLAPEPQAN
jgi:hypothetical protein